MQFFAFLLATIPMQKGAQFAPATEERYSILETAPVSESPTETRLKLPTYSSTRRIHYG